jgi:hypothetical protein
MIRSLVAAMSLAALAIGAVPEESQTRAAKLFESYVALEAAFDPSVADLYSDAAKIQNTRHYPNGRSRTNIFPTLAYKELIRKGMPLAKAVGDSNVYSDVSYTPEGEMFRIRATRYSNRKKYSSPISLLVGPVADGRWLIHEEISESRP